MNQKMKHSHCQWTMGEFARLEKAMNIYFSREQIEEPDVLQTAPHPRKSMSAFTRIAIANFAEDILADEE